MAEENSNCVHRFHHKNSNNFVFCITHTLHHFPILLFFNCFKWTYVYDTLDNKINHSIGVIYTNNHCTFHTKYCMWKYLTPYNCVYTILRKRNTITKNEIHMYHLTKSANDTIDCCLLLYIDTTNMMVDEVWLSSL